jgi:hypothetical protein
MQTTIFLRASFWSSHRPSSLPPGERSTAPPRCTPPQHCLLRCRRKGHVMMRHIPRLASKTMNPKVMDERSSWPKSEKQYYFQKHTWKMNHLLTHHISLEFVISYHILSNYTMWNYVNNIYSHTRVSSLNVCKNTKHTQTPYSKPHKLFPGCMWFYHYLSFSYLKVIKLNQNFRLKFGEKTQFSLQSKGCIW